MEIFSDKEKKILELIKQNQDNQKFDDLKLNQLIQETLIENNNQIDILKKEAEKIESTNRLCNLGLQTLIIQYMEKRCFRNPLYMRLLSLWSSNNFDDWINLGETIIQELGDKKIQQINFTEVKNMTTELVSTVAENLYNFENQSPTKFLDKEVLPNLGQDDFREKLEDDIRIVQVDESEMAQGKSSVNEKMIDKYIKTTETIQKKIEETSLDLTNLKEDMNKMYSWIEVMYLVLSRQQFEEIYSKFKEKRMQEQSNKLKGDYASLAAYLVDLNNILKDLETEFLNEMHTITYSHDYFRVHTQNLIEKYFAPFIQKLLLKGSFDMNLSDLMKILNSVFSFYQILCQNIYEFLEPNEIEEKNFQKVLGNCFEKHFQAFNSKTTLQLENQAQIYLAEVFSRLKQNLQAKIKFQEANSLIQSGSHLKNIDLDPKISNFLEEYNLLDNIAENMEQSEKLVLNKLEESFHNRTISENLEEKHSLITKNLLQGSEREVSEVSRLIKPSGNKGLDNDQSSKKSETVAFLDLTNYNVNPTVLLTEKIKIPAYILYLMNSQDETKTFEIEEAELFDNLLPLRISSPLLKYINCIDSYTEILIKSQKLIGSTKNLVEQVVNILSKVADNLHEKVKEYLELDHPDSLLYFCDWNFINFRISQIIDVGNYLSLDKTGFPLSFLSSFRKKFACAANFSLTYLQKHFLSNFSLLVLPAISNEDWGSFRPFASSELKEEELRIKLRKLEKASTDIDLPYIKNVNYGVRMWKIMLQKRFDELKNFFDFYYVNFYGLKVICNTIIESVSAIYMTYKATKPSRVRNPQYINDLKFFLNNSYHYMRIIFGISIMHLSKEEYTEIKVSSNIKFFLVGTLNTLWWLIKSIRSEIALLESNHHTLGKFLRGCIENQIALPSKAEDYSDMILNILEYLKTEAGNILPELIKNPAQGEDFIGNYESRRETNLNKTGNPLFLTAIQKKLQQILENLANLVENKSQITLNGLYKKFDTKMEALAHLDLAKPKGIVLNVNANAEKATTGHNLPTPQISQKIQLREKLSLEEELKHLLKQVRNPLLRYSQSLFLSEDHLFQENSNNEILSTLLLTPEHIMFIIKKRVEYTFDEYPVLTNENKEAQKFLNPILEEFCSKFELKMFEIPST